MPGPNLLEEALAARAAGLSVMPINAGGAYDKRPHLVLMETGHRRPKAGSPGRWVPAWQPLMETPATEDMITTWFRRPEGKGLAFVTGQRSRRIVIDLDGAPGEALRAKWKIEPHVRTGSGGWHLHLLVPGWRVPTLNGKSARALGEAYPGLDIRGDGGYAILPPTVSRAGPYSWLRPMTDLDNLDVLPLPARAMLGLVQPPAVAPAQPMVRTLPASPFPAPAWKPAGEVKDWSPLIDEAVRRAQLGLGRNTAGFWLACRLRDLGVSASDVKALDFHQQVPPHNTKGEQEAYTAAEWNASVNSAFTQPARITAPKPTPPTVLEQLAQIWPQLQPEEQALALACIVASRGTASDTVADVAVLGVPASAVIQAGLAVETQRQLGLYPPGLTALANRLLPAWRGVDGGGAIGHTKPHQRD